jgi:hypothetical protein
MNSSFDYEYELFSNTNSLNIMADTEKYYFKLMISIFWLFLAALGIIGE